MKDKLVELLKACCYAGKDCNMDCDVCTADHLIANNVVVREKGEWIWGQIKSNGNFWYMCSNCGFAPDEEHPYCPNCGARMDGDT